MEVKIGDYSADFEGQVFGLKNTGDVSQPFKTDYGYNIVKLVEPLPVSTDENDVVFVAWLQTQVQNDGRLDAAKSALAKKWLVRTGFKKAPYSNNNLWAYTDSALKTTKLPAAYKTITPTTVLFQFTKQKITVKDWIGYLQETQPGDGMGQPGYEKQMDNYVNTASDKYFRNHIEDFDASASEQIKEFNEANMLFYEMDKHVWSKAANDTIGQQKYFSQHKANYTWQKSATAIVISAPDKETVDSIAMQLKNNPLQWRNIVAPYTNIYADSNRFEEGQMPVKQNVVLQKDFQSTPEANESGDAFTFIHVLQVYEGPAPKSFEEARGLVINDYQQQLEDAWLQSLKKQYPVIKNNVVFASIK
jgi:peptidyl-prolyl cis-trans isomerase SurA